MDYQSSEHVQILKDKEDFRVIQLQKFIETPVHAELATMILSSI